MRARWSVDPPDPLEPECHTFCVQSLQPQRCTLPIASNVAVVEPDRRDHIVGIEEPDHRQAGVTE